MDQARIELVFRQSGISCQTTKTLSAEILKENTVMKKFFPVVLGLMLLVFLVGCGTQKEDGSVTTSTGEGKNASLEDENATFVIEAAGLKLQYPLRWQELVSVDVDASTAAFSFDHEKLFTLFFNCPDQGNVLGTVCGDENIVITIEDYDVSGDKAVSMQEDVNVILQHLMEDYDFTAGEVVVKESSDVFAIETSVTTLYYPAKWQDEVTVKVSDTKVSFTYGKESLFDLAFTETENGYLLGTYKDTPIYVVDYEATSSEASAMQEDVNVILQHLIEDDNFVINN